MRFSCKRVVPLFLGLQAWKTPAGDSALDSPCDICTATIPWQRCSSPDYPVQRSATTHHIRGSDVHKRCSAPAEEYTTSKDAPLGFALVVLVAPGLLRTALTAGVVGLQASECDTKN